MLRQFVKSGTGFHQSYLFCGGHGSGKCVVGDTLVPTDRGMVPIRSLMGQRQVESTDVLVLQEEGKRVRAAYTYQGGVRETVRIRTHLGYTLEGTPNHRIRMMTMDGVVDWVSLGDIAVGDSACIVGGGPFGTGADLSGFQVERRSPPGGFEAYPFQAPTTLTPDWGRLMGYLIGDGTCTGDNIVVSNSEGETKEDILRLLRNLCGAGGETPDKRSSSGLSSLRCGRVAPRDFLEFAGVHKATAGHKVVPWSVRVSPAPVIREFLRGYMEADGSVGRGGVEVTTKSPRLAHEVHLLLLQFGIVSRLSAKEVRGYGTFYRICVVGTSYATYEREVGFLSTRKREALRALVSGVHAKKRRIINKYDVVPHQRAHLSRFYQGLPASCRTRATSHYFRARRGDGQLTAEKVAHIAETYKDEHFCALTALGYTYDAVVSVTRGEAEVFDLNVPDGEMFAANGFMNHNTTLGRILARALLCENPQEGNPCDECGSCRSIIERGSNECFVEVDAATNSGKDDIRKVIELLQYDTFSGRRRIYLFDEAHRLSKDALDALLKPMEDTAQGTEDKLLVCIFCTTEPERMRATIFSRCAPAFVIRPVPPEGIADRLAWVCEKEGIPYEREALVIIAEAVECHIRDALKSVEGVSMLGTVNVANVKSYLRLNANTHYMKLLVNIGKDLAAVLGEVQVLQEIVSPSTVYERVSELAMLSYRVGLGVGKPPSFWDSKQIQAVWAEQQSFLLQVARTLSTKPGHPTFAMLECDLSALHFLRLGGLPMPASTNVLPQAPLVPANAIQVQPSAVSANIPVAGADTYSTNIGRVDVPEPIQAKPAPSSGPIVTRGGVYVDPRGIERRKDLSAKPLSDDHIPPLDPAEFRRGLGRLVMELTADGRRTRSTG